MRISGPSTNTPDFLKNLDPKKLVDLTADILALRGHTEIKVTDGPGDGCRDIHSINKEGNKSLTQCKFHEDHGKTVSSREIGDLPLGMVKLGYKSGSFVTNGSISPQAKREFINDYLILNLDFVDGNELFKEIMGNHILRSIWYDGERVDRVSRTIIIPFLARELYRGKPLDFLGDNGIYKSTKDLMIEGDEFSSLRVSFRPASGNINSFFPYNPPEIRTLHEGWFPSIKIAEAIISGSLNIGYLEDICSVLTKAIMQSIDSDTEPFSLRLGRPYIVPLSGESNGIRIDLPQEPVTFIKCEKGYSYELDWILSTDDTNWLPPRDVRASTADWFRLYNKNLDCCLNVNVVNVGSQDDNWQLNENMAFFVKFWGESIFALISIDDLEDLLTSGVLEPTQSIDWFESKILVCWLHGNLTSPLRTLLVEMSEPDASDPLHLQQTKFSDDIRGVKQRLLESNMEIIDPSIARHMVAIKLSDPFPQSDILVYRTIDIIGFGNHIPSPISTSLRNISFDVCWAVKSSEIEKFTSIESKLNKVSEKVEFPFKSKLSIIESEINPEILSYIFLELELKEIDRVKSTEYIISHNNEIISDSIIMIEREIKELFSSAKRATSYFWLHEIGLMFQEDISNTV